MSKSVRDDSLGAIAKLAEDARQAVVYYEEKPGLTGARTIIDIYRALALLAEHVYTLQTVVQRKPSD